MKMEIKKKKKVIKNPLLIKIRIKNRIINNIFIKMLIGNSHKKI